MSTRDTPSLTETTRHRLFADDQRRFLVESLWSGRGRTETTLDELATDVHSGLELEADSGGADLESVRCRLHHVHLPMLTDAGLLEYDPETKRVVVEVRAATAPTESL